MNMILHGIEAPNIIHTNTLTENLADIQEKDRYDVVMANPPFGGKERKEVQQNFPILRIFAKDGTKKSRYRIPITVPKTGSPKNKPQNPVTFFPPKKVTAKTPHQPRKTPRSHHQNTTSKTPTFLKNPNKTPQTHRAKK
jgi:hypothetical protein